VQYPSVFTSNPFNSTHAAALINLGEATMGMTALAWSQEAGVRAIPIKLSAEYHTKAKGTLRSVCKLSPNLLPDNESECKKELITEIYDQKGTNVCTVIGTWKISRPDHQEKDRR
jgi:hypothetical protein